MRKSYKFPITMWLSSRLLIVIAMLIIAPLIPVPENGVYATSNLDILSAWDSSWYEKIATSGYDFSSEVKQIHTVAFFPLFPLLTRVLMTIGLPFKVASTLVNNIAFLVALIILYFWVEELYGKSTAKWATATLAWCPYSLYGTVIYTEGLFFLCTIAALKAFEKKQYVWATFWGVLSTATRVPGVALIPAFLFVSWREHRGIKAYIASLTTSLGIIFYSLYCQFKFGDALAFVHAQQAWRGDAKGFAWEGWWKMLMQITVGLTNWNSGYIKDPLHPLLFLIIITCGCFLCVFRLKLGNIKFRYGLYFLWLLLWLLTGDEIFKIILVFGGIYLLWLSRNKIPLVTVVYGFSSLALILNTGITASAERYAYGTISLSIAFGLLLERYPRWGYPIMCFFAILLGHFSVRFARDLWVA
ncbi:mannosyltransferase family protein [Aphanizomenon sp. CS-733/32]|uniref:mannosyltransferase family protein n=1 Tax=Aphanizomenon sp. CS-733/32 TaxID=3021715 RepID=UPI0023309C18|nr:mannosyltransferase family protein [Aphanizomenon sp. CS-733/32]MDB9307843.1 mannosyltransferase family protein [Aphanizomenon sp. CS-733/32]